jgi:cyclin-dependent kinase 7
MVERYIRGRPLGEGTWGQVYEAFRKEDNKRVAIKRMRGKEPEFGLDFTALREIKYLQEIKGPFIEDVSC